MPDGVHPGDKVRLTLDGDFAGIFRVHDQGAGFVDELYYFIWIHNHSIIPLF